MLTTQAEDKIPGQRWRQKDEWQEMPSQEGWYAVLFIWEAREGIMDDGLYWNGSKWLNGPNTAILDSSTEPFESCKAAEDWAERNNPDNADLFNADNR